MKNKTKKSFGILLSLLLSACMLAACSGDDEPQSDPGDGGQSNAVVDDAGNDEIIPVIIADSALEVEGSIYNFYEDGTLIVDSEYIGSYTWDGFNGTVEIGGDSTTIFYDGEGMYIVGEDGEYYEFTYYGEADTSLYGGDDDSDDYDDSESYDISDSSWELDGIMFRFYSDGTVLAESLFEGNVESGVYTWDGSQGQISTDSIDSYIIYDSDGFQIQGVNGTYYTANYCGDASADAPSYYDDDDYDDDDDDDDDSGMYTLGGAYDNDETGYSMEFYDSSFYISTYDAEDYGWYTFDSDEGKIYFEMTDGQEFVGYYDDTDDTFALDSMDGYFESVGSPTYCP